MVFYHILFLSCSKLLEPDQRVAAYAGAFYRDNSKWNKIWYEDKTNRPYFVAIFREVLYEGYNNKDLTSSVQI